MKSYEIYWSDLTGHAQKRPKDLYHENVELTPLAIVDIQNSMSYDD